MTHDPFRQNKSCVAALVSSLRYRGLYTLLNKIMCDHPERQASAQFSLEAIEAGKPSPGRRKLDYLWESGRDEPEPPTDKAQLANYVGDALQELLKVRERHKLVLDNFPSVPANSLD